MKNAYFVFDDAAGDEWCEYFDTLESAIEMANALERNGHSVTVVIDCGEVK